jgi:hypothetical protein
MQIGKMGFIGMLFTAALLSNAIAQTTGEVRHLHQLSCAADEIVKFDGANWVCGKDADTDTSAETECGADEVLLGDGSCASFIPLPVGQKCPAGSAVMGFDNDGKIICTGVQPKSCDDGKPTALVFEYTGEGCDATTHPQGGELKCTDYLVGAEPVQVVMIAPGAVTVTPDDESLRVDDHMRQLKRAAHILLSPAA